MQNCGKVRMWYIWNSERTVSFGEQIRNCCQQESCLLLFIFMFLFVISSANAAMVIDSFSGPVTQNEIDSFKSQMAGRSPAANNTGNAYVYGNSGRDMDSLAKMFEISGDMAILDRLIQYCDAAISCRNDILSAAQGGQRVCWTGNIEPVWPNDLTVDPPGGVGMEQGDIVGHINYCSLLILQNPSIWNTTVGVGDPEGYGTTYLARAQTYITEGDYTMSQFVIPRLINTNDEYWFPGAPNTYKPNQPGPWNQQMMMNDGFLRLAQCHEVLGDNPGLVADYRHYVQVSVDWFLASCAPYTTGGVTAYLWTYAPDTGTAEDVGHGNFDMWGLLRCYEDGGFNVTTAQMNGFANTCYYVIYDPVNDNFHSRVDGTDGSGAPDSYLHWAWSGLSRFMTNPDYYTWAATHNQSRASWDPIYWHFIMGEKDLRYQNPPIGLTGLSVSASSSHGSYPPGNTIDGDLGTRWAGNGDGTWIQYDLGQNLTISFIKMAFYQGTSRLYYFDVQVGDSASGPWTTVLSNVTSAANNDLQTFDFPDITGGYVRVVGHMSNYDTWNNYAEVEVWGSQTPVELLMAHYTFDNGTADDSSGNGNDGTLAGTATVVNDPQRGNVLSLDGSGGKVDLGNPSGLDITGPITVAAWVRIDSAGGSIRNIVNRGHGGSPTRELTFRIDPSSNYNFGSYESGVGSMQTTSAVPSGDVGTNTWVHLAGTWDGSQWNFYRNGNLEDALADSVGPPAMTVGWAIGARGGVSGYERVFDGLIDDVRIYNYALTQSEIEDLVGTWISEDIGSVGQAGNATFDPQTGEFTVNGSGADIWGTADAFHYVDQVLSGDGQIVARVTSVENTNGWAKAGVMIRETTDADSKHAMIAVTPSHGIAFQRRTATAGSSSNTGNSGFTAPYWVKLVRSGSTITGYRSADGQNWVMVGSDTISMANDVLCGLAVTAHNNSTLNTSVFDHVSVSP